MFWEEESRPSSRWKDRHSKTMQELVCFFTNHRSSRTSFCVPISSYPLRSVPTTTPVPSSVFAIRRLPDPAPNPVDPANNEAFVALHTGYEIQIDEEARGDARFNEPDVAFFSHTGASTKSSNSAPLLGSRHTRTISARGGSVAPV